VFERGPRFTPIVKADANVRTVAIVTINIPRLRGSAPRLADGRSGQAATARQAPTRPIITVRMQRIDERMKEGPRTAAEVKKWVDLGYQGFRADGFDPEQVVATLDVALDGRESSVRNRSTNLTDLLLETMRREARTDAAIFNGGSIRIDDVLPPGPVTQYDVIRVVPFGGKIVKATFTGALLSRVLSVGASNGGTGGFLHYTGPTPIDPAARYTLAISDFLLTGGEANLGFLTRQNPDISNITDLRDIRLALIDELKRRFPGR
jgi:5'-nucleotidase/UDP-sugar diphosphatase